jgi:hypothetical protein
MDLLNLEVDGSLSNPHVLAAVAIWTVLLTGAALVVWVRRYLGLDRVIHGGRLSPRPCRLTRVHLKANSGTAKSTVGIGMPAPSGVFVRLHHGGKMASNGGLSLAE